MFTLLFHVEQELVQVGRQKRLQGLGKHGFVLEGPATGACDGFQGLREGHELWAADVIAARGMGGSLERVICSHACSHTANVPWVARSHANVWKSDYDWLLLLLLLLFV